MRTGGSPFISPTRNKPHDRWAIVVAGMHRSGTSVCANVLSRLGADLPRRLIAADAHNPTGYFEPERIVSLNDRLLRAANSSWADWHTLEEDWWKAGECAQLVEDITAAVESEFEYTARALIKDPRIGRMCPLWKPLLARLGYQMLFVIPFRHPLAVARSLQRRSGIRRDAAYLIWLRYLLDAEHATRDQPRLFLDYEWLVQHPEAAISRIASWLPRSLQQPYACHEIMRQIRPDLQHHTSRDLPEGRGTPLVLLHVYESYRKLHEDPDDVSVSGVLNGIRKSLDTAIAQATQNVQRGRRTWETPASTLAAMNATAGTLA